MMDPGTYDVVAQSGGNRFIIVPKGDKDPETRMAQVVDLRRGRAYPPAYLQTIIAQGYWEAPDMPPEEIATAMQGIDNDWWESLPVGANTLDGATK